VTLVNLWTFVALLGVDWTGITTHLDDLLSHATAQIARSSQPAENSDKTKQNDLTEPTSEPKESYKSNEEERLENFWRGYYESVKRFNDDMSKLDWVTFYKNHGYQINPADGSRVLFAPVVASPKMEWGLPVAAKSALPGSLKLIEATALQLTEKKDGDKKIKQAAIPFVDLVVNIHGRSNPYLRAKIMFAVDEMEAKEISDLLEKRKPFLKDWLIDYLSDQSTGDVLSKAGVIRIRREIRNQFNAMLFTDGEEKIIAILFDEFVVQ
jgi:flagellar protein FliL